jgi:hypothetical protein
MEKHLSGGRDLLKHGGFFKSKIINYSVIFSGLASIIPIVFFDLNYFSYITEIVKLINGLVPSLLGFTIAGYSFLMTFIPDRLMKRITKPLAENRLSLYQYITSSLAMNILQHTIILTISIGIYLMVFIQADNGFVFIGVIYRVINIVAFLLINCLLGGALGIVIQIIVSSFNLAQLYHYDAGFGKEEKTIDESNGN